MAGLPFHQPVKLDRKRADEWIVRIREELVELLADEETLVSSASTRTQSCAGIVLEEHQDGVEGEPEVNVAVDYLDSRPENRWVRHVAVGSSECCHDL